MLDGADHPHIAYISQTRGLGCARWTGTTWEIHPFDTNAFSTSLAQDGADLPMAAYCEGTHGDLKLAQWDASQWITSIHRRGPRRGQYTSLALDPGGLPAISYYDRTRSNLKVARWIGTRRSVEIVDAEGNVGSYNALAFDRYGQPVIGYAVEGDGGLKVATRRDRAWHTQLIAGAWQVGSHASLVVYGRGWIYVSYCDGDHHHLKLAEGSPAGVFLPWIEAG